MLKYILQKIKNKMWLSVCLCLGMAFLVAVFSSQPMFKNGSLEKMLDIIFNESIEKNNKYPTVIGRNGSYSVESVNTVEKVTKGIDGYRSTWEKYLSDIDVPVTQTRLLYELQTSQGSYGSVGNYLSVSYMPDIENHTNVLKGNKLSESEEKDGAYPCLMSQSVMDAYGLVVGETLDFVTWKNEGENSLKLYIAGIIEQQSNTDLYWYESLDSIPQVVFVSEETFDMIARDFGPERIYYSHYVLLDYDDINSRNIDNVRFYMEEFHELDANFFDTLTELFEDYDKDRKTINITLWVLEFPVLGMVLAFIYMVSRQILEAEKNEIAMLKSRGFKRKNIFSMYFLQSGILGLMGIIIGLPLGFLLCRLVAGTTDFLVFTQNDVSMYKFDMVMPFYAIIAMLIGMVFVLVPVMSYSKVSIVEHKANYDYKKKQLWEKAFFDIILLVVSLYLLYNFNKNIDELRTNSLNGTKMDPLVFIDSSLFIIGFGLLALRLTHYLVKLIYRIGKRKWKLHTYASFLQISRTFGKQGFISVFMILTVSMGLFNANAACTINKNNEDRIVYENGADATSLENFNIKVFKDSNDVLQFKYIEPDYVKYEKLIKENVCESITRVIRDDSTEVVSKGKKLPECSLFGINTKEFGETAYLKPELYADEHWYNYLNKLGQNRNGVIISRNLSESLNVAVGDKLELHRHPDISNFKQRELGADLLVVTDIVDVWPGFDQYYYENGEEHERYLLVANYAVMENDFGITPYEIWYKLADGVSAEVLQSKLLELGVKLKSFSNVEKQVFDMKNSPMIQVTNGMFTLSFLIAIVLCAVGFLIYWISSIRQRELLFGVYRAMGMTVKNVNSMLINEHIFSTFLAVIAGGVVGMASTFLFVKLFGIVYLPEKHNLGVYVYYQLSDAIKLFAVIGVMIIVCLVILRKLIKSMNITQALKLGEE